MKIKGDLTQFTEKFNFYGKWTISYHDSSHLPPTDRNDENYETQRLNYCVPLVTCNIDYKNENEFASQEVVPFTIVLEKKEDLWKSFTDSWKKESNQPQNNKKDDYIRRIYDDLSEVLTRTRILKPEIDQIDWELLEAKNNLIFITDTNMLRRNVISYLHHLFSHKPIWVIVPVVSMLEFQERATQLNFKDTSPKNLGFTRLRPMITSSTRELLMLKKSHIPVEFLEVPPDLLRYYGGNDPNEGQEATGKPRNILKDRIIIEGIKTIIRERSTNEKMLFLSSDTDMTRFAKIENIEAIHIDKRKLKDNEVIRSIYYDLRKKAFVACGIHEFLWDLTHGFSYVKAYNEELKKVITVNYYFNDKSVNHWENDILEITEQDYEPT